MRLINSRAASSLPCLIRKRIESYLNKVKNKMNTITEVKAGSANSHRQMFVVISCASSVGTAEARNMYNDSASTTPKLINEPNMPINFCGAVSAINTEVELSMRPPPSPCKNFPSVRSQTLIFS